MPGPRLSVPRLSRPPLPALPTSGLPGLVRAPACRSPAGDLPPPGLHLARYPQRLGRGPSPGGLWPAVRDGVGDPIGLRHGPQAPGRATGHDRGAAHLGPDPGTPCPPALPGPRWGDHRRGCLARGHEHLPVPGAGPLPALPRRLCQSIAPRLRGRATPAPPGPQRGGPGPQGPDGKRLGGLLQARAAPSAPGTPPFPGGASPVSAAPRRWWTTWGATAIAWPCPTAAC